MGTADRSAPLRRTGSLLALLALELAAVVGLHWLGRFEGLRIGWAEPVPWLLSSPVQDVLGALLRTVGLVMAYWLLVSTLLYLLASLTRLPAAVRAVGWATLPLVRRVADHAVAVTLATSMVGGGTLGVAGPALAADRGRAGPPARKPVAAAQATDTSAQDMPSSSAAEPSEPPDSGYTPDPAEQVPSTRETTPTTQAPTTEPKPTQPSDQGYTPVPADQTPRRLPASTTTTTEAPTTTKAPTTTEPTTTTTTTEPTTTTTTEPTTTTTTTEPTTTTTEPTTTTAPTTTAAPPGSARGGAAAGTTSTTGLREPSYVPTPATPTPKPPPSGGEPAEPGTGGERTPPKAEKETSHEVAAGENLWTIAQNRLEEAAAGGSGGPTTAEVTQYWERVKEANQDRLESGDADVIEVGEPIILPPVPSTARPAPERRGETTKPAAPGDSLWTLARDHLAAVGNGGEPSIRQVTEYWERVKEANRHRLRSGDADVIEIGEPIILPPVD
jgi:hypothetical protein